MPLRKARPALKLAHGRPIASDTEKRPMPTLALYEDVLSNAAGAFALPARPRMIFVAHGSVTAADRRLRDEETWSGEGAVTLQAGGAGATLWRWEVLADDAGGPVP